MGRRYKYEAVAQGLNGDVVSGANVFVYLAGTTTPAGVYLVSSGGTKVTTAPQLQTDTTGVLRFWIDDEDYPPTQRFRVIVDDGMGFNVDVDDIKIVDEERVIYVDSVEPLVKWVGLVWIDLSEPTTARFKYWDGTQWLGIKVDDILDNTITGVKIVDNSVPGTKLQDGSVAEVKIQDGTITGVKIADNSVPGTKLQDGTVGTSKFSGDAVAPDSSKLGGRKRDEFFGFSIFWGEF